MNLTWQQRDSDTSGAGDLSSVRIASAAHATRPLPQQQREKLGVEGGAASPYQAAVFNMRRLA